MKRVGIIGGSFDPIHFAHLYIANKAKEKLHLDKVIFVPVGSQPLKLHKKVTEASLRFNMVKEAIRGKEGFEVSDYEIKKNGISYTYETLQYFKKQNEKLYFITGADCLINIEKWKNVDVILSLCNFVVFTRPGYDTKKLISQKEYIENKYKGQIIILELEELDISSTEVRERLSSGQDVSNLVPENVLNIICENHLYGED